MQDKIQAVDDAIRDMKTNPILYQEIINEFYKDRGYDILLLLSAKMMVQPFFEQRASMTKYIDDKIEALDAEKERKRQADNYDFLQKEFVWKYRKVTWYLSGAALVVSIISLCVSVRKEFKEQAPARPAKLEAQFQNITDIAKTNGIQADSLSMSAPTKTAVGIKQDSATKKDKPPIATNTVGK